MSEQNKVLYGLKNVFYSKVTEAYDDQTGKTTSSYSNPAPWPGAVSIAQDPQGSQTIFRADNSNYFAPNKFAGFSGAFVCALIPEDVRAWCYGVERDANGVLVETGKSGLDTKYIALMFQFEGDKKAVRHLLYKCSLSRPSITGETTPEGDTPNVQTVSVTVTSMPRADEDELAHNEADPLTDGTVYDGWFSAVYAPDFSMTVSPASLTIAKGETGTITVNRPAGTVTATSSASESGVTAAYSSGVVTVTVAANAAAESATITITDGTTTKTVSVTVDDDE